MGNEGQGWVVQTVSMCYLYHQGSTLKASCYNCTLNYFKMVTGRVWYDKVYNLIGSLYCGLSVCYWCKEETVFSFGILSHKDSRPCTLEGPPTHNRPPNLHQPMTLERDMEEKFLQFKLFTKRWNVSLL